MKSTENLIFELIQSLSAKEKRYFKQFCVIHSYKKTPEPITLFNLIDRAKIYDESKLKQQLKSKDFAYTKHSLTEILHASLRSYHEQSSMNRKAWAYLYSAEIMIKKNLINHANHFILKAKKIAAVDGDPMLLAKLARFELSLLTVPNKLANLIEDGNLIYSNFKTNISDIDADLTLVYFLGLLVYVSRQGYHPNDELHKEIMHRILTNDIITRSPLQLPLALQRNRMSVLSIIYSLKKDIQNANKSMVANLNFFKSNPHIFKENPRHYYSMLSNILTFSITNERWIDAEQYLEVLKLDKENSKTKTNKHLYHFAHHIYLRNAAHYYALKPIDTKGNLNYTEIRDAVLSFDSTVLKEDVHYLLFYRLSIYEFRTRQFSNALKLLTQFEMHEKDKKKFISEHKFSTILKCICLIELEDYDVATNLLRSIKRNRSVNNESDSYTIEVLDYIENLLKHPFKKHSKNILSKPNNEFQLAIAEYWA